MLCTLSSTLRHIAFARPIASRDENMNEQRVADAAECAFCWHVLRASLVYVDGRGKAGAMVRIRLNSVRPRDAVESGA
jgi:hypothetical protein